MKKTLLLVFVFILSLSLCMHATAQESSGVVFSFDNVDIVFENNTSLTFDEQQHLAELFVTGDNNAQTYGLICNIFGHKTSTEYVTTITHCVNSTVPRCLEEDWELVICTRCETIVEETRLGYLYINCCPVD